MHLDPLEIDGSILEGGGQILRTATGFSVLLGRPVRIRNIRAKRKKPGLANQHLEGIRALCRLCDGRAQGLSLGSTVVTFSPGKTYQSKLRVKVETAGSVTLILQGLLIALARSRERTFIFLEGGTDVAWSPPFSFFQHVFSPFLRMMGFRIQSRLIRPGFYPRGGGAIEVSCLPPDRILPLDLSRTTGEPSITAYALASEDLKEARVAERMITGARSLMPGIKGEKRYLPCFSPGASIVLSASFANTVVGADSLGAKGVPAEEVGRRAAYGLKDSLDRGATVDEWAADQIIPFLGLATGQSRFMTPRISLHAETNMEVIRNFIPVRFDVLEKEDHSILACTGVG